MLQDIRQAVRGLGRKPGFAVIALLTLTLGIGANTVVFSIARGLLMRPLPVASPDRIFLVQSDRTYTHAAHLP